MKNNAREYFDEKLGERYFAAKLESGLDVYVFPKKMTVSYALIGADFGSLAKRITLDGKEREYPMGVAHFLEHKLFSCEDGSDAFEKFAALGADANAYTSFSKTVYLFSCTDNFYESLEQLLSFVSSPYFSEEGVERERSIIEQEIRMCDDSPYDRVSRNLLYAMYGDCVISENACGSVESISGISADTLYENYGLFYRPSNMALVVCGDVDKDRVIELAKTFSPKAQIKGEVTVKYPDITEEVFKPYFEQKMPVGKPIFELGVKDAHVPNDPIKRLRRDVAMTVLDEILFSRAGELYGDMLDEGLITPSYSYGYSMSKELAFHSIFGESDEPKKVLERVRAHIEKAKKNGISKSDFLRCKRVLQAEFIRDFDSTDDIANSLIDFAFDGAQVFEYRRAIEELTYEDVCKCLEEAFCDEYFALSVICE